MLKINVFYKLWYSINPNTTSCSLPNEDLIYLRKISIYGKSWVLYKTLSVLHKFPRFLIEMRNTFAQLNLFYPNNQNPISAGPYTQGFMLHVIIIPAVSIHVKGCVISPLEQLTWGNASISNTLRYNKPTPWTLYQTINPVLAFQRGAPCN